VYWLERDSDDNSGARRKAGGRTMSGSLLGTLRRLFWISAETVADTTERYWEIFIKSSLVLGICLAIEFGIFSLFSGKSSAFMPIMMAVTGALWTIAALPILILTIIISQISIIGKIFKIIFIVLILGFGISILMIKGHLWEYPTISWMLLFTSAVAVIGQIFSIKGFAGHIVTGCMITFFVIAGVVVPIIMFVPTTIQSSVASRASDAQYRLFGADQDMITPYLCEKNGRTTVCDKSTGERLRLRRPNGDPAVFTAFYDGQTELYDNGGPHPITGRQLRPADEDDLAKVKQELLDRDAGEKQKIKDQEQQELKEKQDQERQNQELLQKAQAEQKRIQQEAEKETERQKNLDTSQPSQPMAVQPTIPSIQETPQPITAPPIYVQEEIIDLPVKTKIALRVTQEITNTNVSEGDIFYFSLDKEIKINGQVLFRRDATVELMVTAVRQKTQTTEPLLILKVNKIGGIRIDSVSGSIAPGKNRVKSGAIGAAIGGIAGAIIGGKTGAVIGAGAGGATGAGVAPEGDIIRLKVGDKIEFQVR